MTWERFNTTLFAWQITKALMNVMGETEFIKFSKMVLKSNPELAS